MNGWDWLVLALVAALIVLAARSIRKGKTGGCSGNCDACESQCSKKPPHC